MMKQFFRIFSQHTTPVSYTHLDVYKRQRHGITLTPTVNMLFCVVCCENIRKNCFIIIVLIQTRQISSLPTPNISPLILPFFFGYIKIMWFVFILSMYYIFLKYALSVSFAVLYILSRDLIYAVVYGTICFFMWIVLNSDIYT